MRQGSRATRIAGCAAVVTAAVVVLAPASSRAGSTAPPATVAPASLAAPASPPPSQQPPAQQPLAASPPQAAAPRDRYSGQTINRLSGPTAPGTKPSSTAPAPPGYSFDAPRVGAALLTVLALIFALRWIGHRVFPGTAAGRATKSIRVLSRSVIGPKQQIMLVQVGKRVIVVGDSGQQLTALSEITDPDEVTTVLGDVHADRTPSVANPFGKLFGRAKDDFSDDPESAKPPGEPSSDAGEPFPSHRDGGAAEDASISLTRDELSGLSEKIRGLSQQLGRG